MKQFSNGSQSTDNTVEIYDIATDTWSDAAPIPVPVHHANAAAVNGKIYVLGAITGVPPRMGVVVPMTYRYDPATNGWEELGRMPIGTERGASAVAVRGNIVYLAGGLQRRPNVTNSAVDLVTSYDTVSGKWTTLPRIPEIRDHVGGAVVGDTFFVVGGRAGKIESVKDTVFAFNLTSNSSWVTLNGKMPTPRGGIATAVVGKKIYTFGGEGDSAPGSNGTFPMSESYDVVRDAWTKEIAMKTPRHGMGAVVVGGTVHIPGGSLAQDGAHPSDANEAFISSNCELRILRSHQSPI